MDWQKEQLKIWKKEGRKKFTDRQTDKHSYRKGKNYISPIYFIPGGGGGGGGGLGV